MNSGTACLTSGQTPGSRDDDPSVFANKSGTSVSQLPYSMFKKVNLARCTLSYSSSSSSSFSNSLARRDVEPSLWTGVRTFVPKGPSDLQINFGAAGSSQNLFSVFHQSDVQSCLQFRAQPREVLLRVGSEIAAPDSTQIVRT